VAFYDMSKDDDFELYVDDTRRTTDSKKNTPKLDPAHRQGVFWTGDMALSGKDLNFNYFLVRDGPAGNYSVYLKVLHHNPSGPPVNAVVIVATAAARSVSPSMWISKETMLIPVGTVKVAGDYSQTVEFNVPTELTVKPGLKPGTEPKPGDKKQ
jgi:hypothetical protein